MSAPLSVRPEDNLGLVHLCARRFSRGGAEYDDLFQAGCVGLVKAARDFDPDRGLQFSTYAVPVILGEMRRLFREGGAVRVSRGLRELARRARETDERLRDTLGRAPSLSELAGEMGVSPEKAGLALGAARPTVSLSGEEDGEPLDIPVEGPEERVTERVTLLQLLLSLPERDRALLDLRYRQGKTQAQTGASLGMSQVQVSRREKKLLLYLRGELLGEDEKKAGQNG